MGAPEVHCAFAVISDEYSFRTACVASKAGNQKYICTPLKSLTATNNFPPLSVVEKHLECTFNPMGTTPDITI